MKPTENNTPDNPTPALQKRRGLLLFAAVSLILVAFVYKDVYRFDFVLYDDNEYIYENFNIQYGFTMRAVSWAFTGAHSSNWHPLTWLSHILDYSLFGMHAGGHHVMNVIFHWINTLLLFVLWRKLTDNAWGAAFAALVFALHPAHVESVAWISERKDVLSTMFFLLTLLAYDKYVQNKSAVSYIILAILFVFGLMAKPMVVTIPIVLLLLDVWPYRRLRFLAADAKGQRIPLLRRVFSKENLRIGVEKIPLFLLAAGSGFVTILVQQKSGAVGNLEGFPMIIRLMNATLSYAGYLGKLFYPANLAVFYPYASVFNVVEIGLALGLLIGITVAALYYFRTAPYFFVGWAFYIVTLLPVIGILQVGLQAFADRYTYIPSIGILIAIVPAATEAVKRWKSLRIPIAAAAFAACAVLFTLTCFQAPVWENSVTLFTHAIQAAPPNKVAHQNLGSHYFRKGELQKSYRYYTKAIAIDSSFEHPFYNVGLILQEWGKDKEAVPYFQKAIRIKPNFFEPYIGEFYSYMRMGDSVNAVKAGRAIARLEPYTPRHHNYKGYVFMQMGMIDSAVYHFKLSMMKDPRYDAPYLNMGNIFVNMGKLDDARKFFAEAVKYNPHNTDALARIGDTMALQNRYQDAVPYYSKALAIEPKNKIIRASLERALLKIDSIRTATRKTANATQSPT